MHELRGLFDLTGMVAIVTGAGRGLGRKLSHGLAVYGATVVACDRDETSAVATAEALRAAGHKALATRVDIADYASCEALLDFVMRECGQVDVLVNNAAIDVIEPLDQITPANWHRIIDVNLTGTFYCAQLAAKAMVARGAGGSIINISSLASVSAIANLAAYSAAKSGVNQLTRSMALELAPARVRVNAVAPGYLENVMLDAGAEHANPAKEASIRAKTPMGRRARLDELVGPIVFLASEASSYVTGAVLHVDGGWTAV
jgi:NAD(P)-dependent dehydrogenase (short-subunit alcohol dehydrogenase family)